MIMEQEKVNAKNVKNLNEISSEANRLHDEVEALQKKILDLDKDKKIAYLDNRIEKLLQFKDNYEGLVKHIEEAAKKDQKETDLNLQKFFSLKVGYWTLVFLGAYSLLMLVFAVVVFLINDDSKIIMTLIIGGLSALLIFAVVLIFFAYKTKDILI